MTEDTSRTKSMLVSAGVAVLGVAVVALAHPDDPKEKDREPPYRGPGYRAADGGQPRLGFPTEGIELMAWLPLEDFGVQHDNANDCWGYVSQSGREYAILGLSHGTAFVDVTEPGDPAVVDVIDGPISLWRDVKIYQNFAYAVTEGTGAAIQVFDLSSIDLGTVSLVNTINDGGSTKSHNVTIDTESGFLYRIGGSGNGLRAYSLEDPVSPEFVGSWGLRYVHDAQAVTYTEGDYAGRQIVFACSGFNGGWVETGLDIIDVTDKDNIHSIGRIIYPNGAYSHQVWLSENRQYAYLNDELDENGGIPTTTYVIDVSNLENPVSRGTFTNGNTAIGHNLYVRGDLIFEANYRSGLRVFDAADDPERPVEIAYFDTYPSNDGTNFNGLWSNYPFFPSGTVIGSDMEKGLFVWSVDALQPEASPDINDDGVVDVNDLLMLLDAWGECDPEPADCPADLNGDGWVDVMDLLQLLDNWG